MNNKENKEFDLMYILSKGLGGSLMTLAISLTPCSNFAFKKLSKSSLLSYLNQQAILSRAFNYLGHQRR